MKITYAEEKDIAAIAAAEAATEQEFIVPVVPYR